LIERLVPSAVATAETREDILEIELFEAERRAMGRAVEKRRREFITGRACARRALAKLGVAPVAIASGARGQPLWPAGVVGSITHCPGYRACAVARTSAVTSLGIDAEVNEPLPAGVLEQVAFGPERELAAAGGGAVRVDRLLFSAKEAIYKAWFPVAGCWLGFEDVELGINMAAETFEARLLVDGPVVDGGPLTRLSGRWCLESGILCTAVIIGIMRSAETAGSCP
jgi:4'-phosphopantetheinyl transferase EntD